MKTYCCVFSFVIKFLPALSVILLMPTEISLGQSEPSRIQEPINGGCSFLIYKSLRFNNDSQPLIVEVESYVKTNDIITFITRSGDKLTIYHKNNPCIIPFPDSLSDIDSRKVKDLINDAIKRFPQYNKQLLEINKILFGSEISAKKTKDDPINYIEESKRIDERYKAALEQKKEAEKQRLIEEQKVAAERQRLIEEQKRREAEARQKEIAEQKRLEDAVRQSEIAEQNEFYITIFVGYIFFALVGWAIGSSRGIPLIGIFGGLFLGPIGWLIACFCPNRLKEKEKLINQELIRQEEALSKIQNQDVITVTEQSMLSRIFLGPIQWLIARVTPGRVKDKDNLLHQALMQRQILLRKTHNTEEEEACCNSYEPLCLDDEQLETPKTFRVMKDGNDLGIMSVRHIKVMLQNGKLNSNDLYFDLDANDWMPLDCNTSI